MDMNEMKKELFYEPKHAMETVDDVVVKAADDFCEGYKAYLDFAKIEPDEAGNRNVVIVGCGDFGEIWSEALYNKHVDEMDIEEIRRSLEESGL